MAEKNHQNAIQDNNQFPALIAHSGTAGTAETVRLTATSNGYLNVNSAAELTVGTIDRVNTIGTLELGTVVTTMGDLSGGTLGLITRVSTLGTMEVGTISALPNIPGGTIGLVSNLANGTIAAVTSVANLANGTLAVVSSLANLVTGTVNRINGGTIVAQIAAAANDVDVTSGSIAVVAGTVSAGTINVGTVVGDIASGAADSGNPVKVGAKYLTTKPTFTDGQRGDLQIDTRGNLRTMLAFNDSVTNVIGLADNVDAAAVSSSGRNIGVVNRNTVYNGTEWDRMRGDTLGVYTRQNPKPTIVTNAFGTTTAGTIGTLVAAPSAGSAIFITSLDISAVSGTAEVVVSYGLAAAGNQVINRGLYAAGGGIAKSYVPANSGSSTGTALTWNMLSGSGTVAYSVAYFIAVP